MSRFLYIPLFIFSVLVANLSWGQSYWASRSNAFSFHHSTVPYLIKPFELGFVLNTQINQQWGMAYNYRFGFANSKEKPKDYDNFGIFSDIEDLNPANLETIHTVSVRATYKWDVLTKLNWRTEMGPSYLYYINKSYTVPRSFFFRNYEIHKNPYHLIGLSIQNSFSISKSGRTNVYLYHSINARFSHTVLGLQYFMGKSKKV